MPRANRFILPGHIYHLTHCCHARRLLLRVAKDRNHCRPRLRKLDLTRCAVLEDEKRALNDLEGGLLAQQPARYRLGVAARKRPRSALPEC